MTPEELMRPLSPIEAAELSNAASNVLTVAGMNLLRRVLMENETLRTAANAGKVEAYDDVLRLLERLYKHATTERRFCVEDGNCEASARFWTGGMDRLQSARVQVQQRRRDAAEGGGG